MLQDIGEEFVEFLEKELKIDDRTNEQARVEEDVFKYKNDSMSSQSVEEGRKKVENDIENMLAELKKEMGL